MRVRIPPRDFLSLHIEEMFRYAGKTQTSGRRITALGPDLGPEGIAEAEQVSNTLAGLVSRTRALRKMLPEAAPVFRRLMKSTGYLDAARKALLEAAKFQDKMDKIWGAFVKAETAFLRELFAQNPDLYREYMAKQRGEGA